MISIEANNNNQKLKNNKLIIYSTQPMIYCD